MSTPKSPLRPRDHPLIGVTTYGRNEVNRFHLPAEYVDAVRRAGGIPLLIPPGESQWEALRGYLDGVVLTGGGDIDPRAYGGRDHETIYNLDHERDASELALGRQVVETGLPTLGICRGMQILNVTLGGSLIEHLPDEVGEQVIHRAPPREPIPHSISVIPDSRLAAVTRELEFSCSSWHHQAIRRLAPGLKVVALAPDHTIEAVELPGHPWLVAVQWHPELTAAYDPIQQRLFDALVQAALQRRR